MPSSVGPNIFGKENLVFGYDLGDVSNSYRGEPTINLTTDTPLMSGWQGTFTLVNTTSKTFIIETKQDNAATTSAWRTYYWNVSSYVGLHITISASIKFISETNCNFRDFHIGQGNTGSFPLHIAGSSAQDRVSTSIKPITKIFITWSGIVNATGIVGFTQWIHNVTANGANSILEVSNVQIESKSHATPFVNGTRSATQGLIDFKGTSTIDLTNVSFDSNAQMTFDGTDDWLNAPVTLNAGNFTYETVMQANSTDYKILTAGTGNPAAGSTLIQSIVNSSGALINLYNPVGVSGWQYGSYSNLSGYTGVANAIRHIVVVNTANNWKTYVNGVLVGNTNLSIPTVGNAVGIARTGMQVLNPVATTVYAVKIYSCPLTAEEIRSNFNAVKKRFNI